MFKIRISMYTRQRHAQVKLS